MDYNPYIYISRLQVPWLGYKPTYQLVTKFHGHPSMILVFPQHSPCAAYLPTISYIFNRQHNKLLSITPSPAFWQTAPTDQTTPRTCWWCHLYWSRCILLQHTLHPNSQHRYHSLALRVRQVGLTFQNHGKFGVQYTCMAATLAQQIYNRFYFQRTVELSVHY